MSSVKMFHDIEQNTDLWLDLRIAKLTGSDCSKIMANYPKAFGDPAKKVAIRIAREQVTGKRSLTQSFSNSHTERGHEQEPVARSLYEEQRFVTVSNGGFFDNGQTGCSPDGLVYHNGVIEIKSVIDTAQFANIKRGGIDPAYKWQVMFNLMETGRTWLDFISYCADFPEQTKIFSHRVYAFDCGIQFLMINARKKQFFKFVEKCKPIIAGK